MPRVPLNESAVIRLNASGNGTAKIGPLSAREVWYPRNVAVSVTTNVKEATCVVSVGNSNTKSFRDGCVDGSSGDSTGNVTDTIKCGSYVWADWTGGDALAYATLTVTGDKDV